MTVITLHGITFGAIVPEHIIYIIDMKVNFKSINGNFIPMLSGAYETMHSIPTSGYLQSNIPLKCFNQFINQTKHDSNA